MTHFLDRTDFLAWLAIHAPDNTVKRALDMGTVTVWGLFKGGFVVEVSFNKRVYYIGVRASTHKPGEYFTGLLSRVPFKSYVGGDTPLTRGDRPDEAKDYVKQQAGKLNRPFLPKML